MEFERVFPENEGDVEALSRMATDILREHYDPIVGKAQNDYMLDRFQSIPAIREQLEHGYRYFFALDKGRRVGFLAFYPREDHIYLSKLYLLKDARGRGFARPMVALAADAARQEGLRAIELNVNKQNPSVAIYERLGFVQIRSEKNDIGSGYFMDDYVYRLEI